MHPEYIVIDLFCGAGGTTLGFDMAMINGRKAAFVVACVNHDPLAIDSHWENHPEVYHFLEDITLLYGRVLNGFLFMTEHMRQLVRIVNIYRAFYPEAKVILWASLECTNFSKAKGGKERDADSRTLAHHLDRYVVALDPDYVQIENVVEFMSWGPMNEKGKPISSKNGRDWIRWKQHLCSFGYRDEWRELNSADFGAYTSRNRLFGIFAKPGMPIIWPKPTHSKKPSKGGMFGDLKKWKAVKDVLDFDDEGQSIFGRKKPLVDASLERIYAGLVKFVAGGKDAFILKYNSLSSAGKHVPPSIDEPCPTIACQNRLGIVNASFIAKYYSGKPAGKVIPVTGPAGTIATAGTQALVNASFLTKYYSGDPDSKVTSVEEPAAVIRTKDGQSLIQCQPFILNTNFNNVGKSIDEPAPTLVSSRRHPYLLSPAFLTQYYSSGGQLGSIDEPARTLGTRDTIAKIQTEWIERQFGKSQVSSVESPAGTLMPNDKHRLISCDPFILNPSHGGHTTSTMQPCPVIIARQDKAPLYLIQFDIDPEIGIPVYDDDPEVMIRIKIFMSMYGIADIKMRMLKVPELLCIQGFPANYKLAGNQSDQKKFIGNSVVPHVVKAWTESLAA
ncbi:DNA methyltransferase [Dyadobacter endophyticus]|uniref:DNA (cytosine-5-)-methyltransferase n=1 Tax=Dyadobacter endophyticus TaxID=1749036 RepID=A0ABQ1YXU8_9BACT|nr:DNA cytosine methyltransferase [Dyadobacter endophyticus]GGH42777.1 DNA methyltransferase [Dyadobacter endophyticus]